jgi:hypothetical protein
MLMTSLSSYDVISVISSITDRVYGVIFTLLMTSLPVYDVISLAKQVFETSFHLCK